MLKGLKDKKAGKGDTKKEAEKKKQPKEQIKKKEDQQQEEDTNDALVEINYEEKEKGATKNAKKVQAYKLEEKEIDTANIKIEKKEEKPKMTSWVVNAEDIGGLMKKDFDATKHETEFESLTDEKLNKELEEKAKKEAEENKNKPQIQQVGGFKFAPLGPTSGPTSAKVDVNEPLLSLRKPAVDVNSNPTSLPITQINPPTFTNSNMKTFAPLEKSAEQLREEEIERKMKERGGNIVLKGQGQTSWLGGKKVAEEPKQEMKLSGWAVLGMKEGESNAPKFAPLNQTGQQKRYQRQEQQFVFTSKKEQEQRRRKREAEEAAKIKQ